MLIELQKITKTYHNGTELLSVLSNLDLTIEQGEYISIIGRSGSGKSTLLNILSTLDSPSSGVYRFLDKNISEFSSHQMALIRNNHIGFVFQNFNLIPRLSVYENIDVPLIYGNHRHKIRHKRILDALDRVGLTHKINALPSTLSGGEKQRVAIARSIINTPNVLIADEPTGNLDIHNSREIMKLFRELNNEGVTIILVTHEKDIAQEADIVYQLENGRLTKEVLRQKQEKSLLSKHDACVITPYNSVFYLLSGLSLEIGKIAIRTLFSNKTRSFLMLLSMFIAVCSVVLSIAIGTAGRKLINSEINALGNNTIWIYREYMNRNKMDKDIRFSESTNEINTNDLARLRNKDLFDSSFSPELIINDEISYQSQTDSCQLTGTSDDYLYTSNSSLFLGRFFSPLDIESLNKVCILTWPAYLQFVKNGNPIGKAIYFNNHKLKIIGVLKKRDTWFLNMIGVIGNKPPEILIPVTLAQNVLGTVNLHAIAISVKDKQKIPFAKEYFLNVIRKQHGEKIVFASQSLDEHLATSNRIMGTLTIVLGIIAGISLIIGGIGIMNIMFVLVVERTKEIGIRMALGARDRDILLQFLIESAIIGLIGGGMGSIFGGFGIIIINLVSGVNAFSLFPFVMAFVTATCVGVFAGIYPALKAVKLKPADTLKYE